MSHRINSSNEMLAQFRDDPRATNFLATSNFDPASETAIVYAYLNGEHWYWIADSELKPIQLFSFDNGAPPQHKFKESPCAEGDHGYIQFLSGSDQSVVIKMDYWCMSAHGYIPVRSHGHNGYSDGQIIGYFYPVIMPDEQRAFCFITADQITKIGLQVVSGRIFERFNGPLTK